MTTMADLTEGTRVRHLRWRNAGTIRKMHGRLVAVWDATSAADEISDEGPIYPGNLEIIGEASWAPPR